MKLLQRHISSTIIYATLIVLLVLVGVQVFISFVQQLNEIGAGHFGVLQAFQYVLFTLPSNIYFLFPMAGLLGSLLGLGYLASNSELVVMRTSGMSILQIMGAVLFAAVLLLVVMTLLGEGLGPQAKHLAQIEKIASRHDGHINNTIHGMWVKKDNNFIYINSLIPGVQLEGVNVFRFNDQAQLTTMLYAKNAVYQQGSWLLKQVAQTEFDNNHHANTKFFAQKLWSLHISTKLLKAADINLNDISLSQLNALIKVRKENGLSVAQYSLKYWQRIFRPLATLIMIFLAIPFIFGPLRSVSMGVRIIAGVVVGFTFYILNQFLGPFSLVYRIPPIIAALLPIVLFLIIGYFLMRRAR